jgi:hypothetical protein
VTYAGDSVAKKEARLMWWTQAMRLFGHRWKKARALVLLGDGGDVRVLRALGLEDTQITAVDTDEAVVERAQRDLGFEAVHGDVRDVTGLYDVALIDLCGPLPRDPFDSDHPMQAAIMRVRNGGVAGIGCMYGRDRWVTERVQARVFEAWERRALVAQGALTGAVSVAHNVSVALTNQFAITYRSRTDRKIGTPMILLGWRAQHVGPGRKGRRLARKLRAKDRRAALATNTRGGSLGLRWTAHVGDGDEDRLRRIALAIYRDLRPSDPHAAARVADALNVDKAQVAAWAAVATRTGQ